MTSERDNHTLAKPDPALPMRSFAWLEGTILDACTVQAAYGQLLILDSAGVLHGMQVNTGAVAALCAVRLPALPPGEEPAPFGAARLRLHAASDGTHAAIVVDKGRQGVVVHVGSGTVTMPLDGGDYYQETVPFSACFVRFEGRDVLVHRTAWNRLDASDPASGMLLTARHIAEYEDGANRPAHYLDYFHGRLRPSPDGSRLFDDGWVWHPVSVPRTWSVIDWLGTNPWETEDGASIVDLMMRDDWSTPACWIDNQRLAVWSMEEWDAENQETRTGPHVRIIDATAKVHSPAGIWPMAPNEGTVLDLFSDGQRLYVVDDAGTTVWDIASRTRLARLPDFVACLHDAARGVLIAVGPSSIVELLLQTPEAPGAELSNVGVATRIC